VGVGGGSGVGTVLRICLMTTGPEAAVGFCLMAVNVAGWRGKKRGILAFWFPGAFERVERFVLEKGNVFVNARGWDINSAADPTWAKCLRFWYRVASEARLPRLATNLKTNRNKGNEHKQHDSSIQSHPPYPCS